MRSLMRQDFFRGSSLQSRLTASVDVASMELHSFEQLSYEIILLIRCPIPEVIGLSMSMP